MNLRWFVLAMTLVAQGATAQDGWGDLDGLLLSNLSQTGDMEASLWMPDSADPAHAQVALGIAYVHIPGSAGSVSIHVGIFRKQDATWIMTAPVSELFGHEPRNSTFLGRHVELLTTMPGPNDPRCCPTQEAKWRIDLATGLAQRLY